MRRGLAALVALVASLPLTIPTAAAAATPAATPTQVVAVDGNSPGRTFEGVGALSAGASSRLLIDYPEPERSQILDYLFTPGYGASLQILKVEIGGDTNSTAGSEPSHERRPGQVNCGRGYEWWLMEQARRRNPNIKIDALAWGTPGWFHGGLWSRDYIDYLMAWLGCARSHGLTVDYVGGLNEKDNPSDWSWAWFKELKRALREHGFHTKVVCCDLHQSTGGWNVVDAMKADPGLYDAIDVVGLHATCRNLVAGTDCPSPDSAKTLGKPLQESELPLRADHNASAAMITRALNRVYIDGRMTSTILWALIASWYPSLTPAYAGRGLIRAYTPWSGNYQVGKSVWSIAQTTQFADPGWRYLDSATGYLSGGGSYVTLRSPATGDYSTIVETADATAPQTVTFDVTGGLSRGTVHIWSTDLRSSDPADYFVHARDLTPSGGSLTVTLDPGYVYTLTTTTGQGKGTATPPPASPLRLPYPDGFDRDPLGTSPRYFSDVNAAFQVGRCNGGRTGRCLEQVITQAPMSWHEPVPIPPSTVMGDSDWTNYTVATDVLFEQAGWVELLGRVRVFNKRLAAFAGYHLRVYRDGRWSLYREDEEGDKTTLASGEAAIAPGSWHRLSLTLRGYSLEARLDGRLLARTADNASLSGQVGLAVSPWQRAEFDNLTVTPARTRGSLLTVSAGPAPVAFPEPGAGAQVRAVVTNPGPARATHVDPHVSTPAGWSVQPLSAGSSTLAPKDSSVWVWQVTPPANATPGIYHLAVTVTYRSYDQTGPVTSNMTAYVGMLPHSEMTATATSYQNSTYAPEHAIDGDVHTMWHSPWNPYQPLPQAITLRLDNAYDVDGLLYQPRVDGNHNGIITGYNIFVSTDGTTFTKVASGTWADDATQKTVRFAARNVRAVRLQAVQGHNGYASAAEINLLGTPSSS